MTIVFDTKKCVFDMYKRLNKIPVKYFNGGVDFIIGFGIEKYGPAPDRVLFDGEPWVLKNKNCLNAYYEKE